MPDALKFAEEFLSQSPGTTEVTDPMAFADSFLGKPRHELDSLIGSAENIDSLSPDQKSEYYRLRDQFSEETKSIPRTGAPVPIENWMPPSAAPAIAADLAPTGDEEVDRLRQSIARFEWGAKPLVYRGFTGEVGAGLARGMGRHVLGSAGGLMKMGSPLGKLDPLHNLHNVMQPAREAYGEILADAGEDVANRYPKSDDVEREKLYVEGEGFNLKNTAFSPRWMAANVSEMIPLLAAQLGMAYASGGTSIPQQTLLFAGTSAAAEAGSTYNEASRRLESKGLSKEKSHEIASTEATVYGMVAGVIDVVPGAGRATAPAKASLRRYVKQVTFNAIEEGGAESAQELASMAVQMWAEDDPEAFADWKNRMATSAVVGAAAGGVMTNPRPAAIDNPSRKNIKEATGKDVRKRSDREQIAEELRREWESQQEEEAAQDLPQTEEDIAEIEGETSFQEEIVEPEVVPKSKGRRKPSKSEIDSPRPTTTYEGYQGRGATAEEVYGADAVKQGRAVPVFGPGDLEFPRNCGREDSDLCREGKLFGRQVSDG